MADRTKVVTRTTVHVPLSSDLKKKLVTMTERDHRKHSDFIRLLIDEEWDRRQAPARGNVHLPAEDHVEMFPHQCTECEAHFDSPRKTDTLCGTCSYYKEHPSERREVPA